jgi:hypothetical protein
VGGPAGRGRRCRRAGPRNLDHYHARYQTIIDEGWRANPAVRASGDRRRRQRRSKAANLLARLDDHRQEVLRFATDFRVPFDNNQAERDIRMAKLQQKISGGWRTLAGAQRFCRLAATWRPPANSRSGCSRRYGGCSRATPGYRPPPVRNTPAPDGAC